MVGTPAPRSVRARIEGRVQGVGFRWFARRVARELGVGGWVRNLPDGAVEARASGTSEAVAAFLDRVRVGPGGARVRRVDVVELGPDGEAGDFEIRA